MRAKFLLYRSAVGGPPVSGFTFRRPARDEVIDYVFRVCCAAITAGVFPIKAEQRFAHADKARAVARTGSAAWTVAIDRIPTGGHDRAPERHWRTHFLDGNANLILIEYDGLHMKHARRPDERVDSIGGGAPAPIRRP